MAIWMFCFMSVGLILLSVSSAISACVGLRYQCQYTDKRWILCVCKCDGEDNCRSSSDEANCTNLLCPQCDHNGRCIPMSSKCDRNNDGEDGDRGNEPPDCDKNENSSTVRAADLSSMSSTVATMETDFTSTEVKTESSSTVRVADLSSMSSTVAAMKTESDDSRTLNSSTQSPTGSYSVTDAGSNNDKSNSPNIGLIVGVVVGVGGGVILIIVAVLIGIIIRRRRIEKQDRFTNPSVIRQNRNTANENAYGNPIIPPYASFDELTTSAQPHLIDPYESLTTDGTYATTGTQETDVGRNMETEGESSSVRPSDPVNSNNEASNYDNFNTTANVEYDTNLVENDLYGDENYATSVKKDLLGIDNDTTLVENDLYGNENNTILVEKDLVRNENDTTLVENDLYGNENDTTLVEHDLYGSENDTTLVEHDLYGSENDTTLVENDLYGK